MCIRDSLSNPSLDIGPLLVDREGLDGFGDPRAKELLAEILLGFSFPGGLLFGLLLLFTSKL